jgi:hypothetical protein
MPALCERRVEVISIGGSLQRWNVSKAVKGIALEQRLKRQKT